MILLKTQNIKNAKKIASIELTGIDSVITRHSPEHLNVTNFEFRKNLHVFLDHYMQENFLTINEDMITAVYLYDHVCGLDAKDILLLFNDQVYKYVINLTTAYQKDPLFTYELINRISNDDDLTHILIMLQMIGLHLDIDNRNSKVKADINTRLDNLQLLVEHTEQFLNRNPDFIQSKQLLTNLINTINEVHLHKKNINNK